MFNPREKTLGEYEWRFYEDYRVVKLYRALTFGPTDWKKKKDTPVGVQKYR
jgi:hypothetical protein